MLSILCSVIISGISILLSSGERDDYWYDFYYKYYNYPKELTDSIDRALIRNYPQATRIGKIRIITPAYFIPDQGYHYMYFSLSDKCQNQETGKIQDQSQDLGKCKDADPSPGPTSIQSNSYFHPYPYIGLYKKREIIGSSETYTYIAWVSPYNHNLINCFNNLIIDNSEKIINVFQIDTSTVEPQAIYVQKIYKEPTILQKLVINEIMDHWKDPRSHNNTKVFLHGRSGIGKSFTSYGLKKEIETTYKTNVMLYDDFNPSIIGVSIQKILANARKDMPVLIVMNEIDIAYHKVFSKEQSFDPRGFYTKDKTSFNNLLDYISTIRYVIIIFTSEKSPEQLLNENPNYGPFIRQGRIDMFIEMIPCGINRTFLDLSFHT